ncbi:MAG: amino acid ABC transporter permease [Pseudomonadota bacterium]
MKKTSPHPSTILNITLATLMLSVIGVLYWRVTGAIEYEWQWGEFFDYLGYTDKNGDWCAGPLLRGLATTVRLSVWSAFCALLFGGVFGLMRVSHRPLCRLISGTYIGIIRNVPPIILVFILYFFVSSQIMPVLGLESVVRGLSQSSQTFLTFAVASPAQLTAFMAGVVTLGLYEGAYIAEIVRAGIQSVPKGQWEAAEAFGLSRYQKMRRVILPQALRHAVPPLAGQGISIIKNSAIVSVISVQELTFQGMELMAATYMTFEIWLSVALAYAFLTCSFAYVARRVERHFTWSA